MPNSLKIKKIFSVVVLLILSLAWGQEKIILNKDTIRDYYPKVGLALGGGSARGFFHIGVLKVLEREGIPVAMIAGTSMGSIIGGLTAQGYDAAEIEKIIADLDFDAFFSTAPITKKTFQSKYVPWVTLFQKEPVGIFTSSQLEEFLRRHSLATDYQADFDFNNYPIPLRVVAADFLNGEEKVFDRGPLYQTVAASTAIPFIFKPYYLDNRYFFDGGIAELVPVSPLKSAGMTYIIGVNVMHLNKSEDNVYELPSYAWHFNDLLVTRLGEKTLRQADWVIDFGVDPNLGMDDYHKFRDFIKVGEEQTAAELPKFNAFLDKYDNNFETIFLTKVINKTDIAIPEFKTGWQPKNKIIRTIYKYSRGQEVVLNFSTDSESGTSLLIERNERNILKQIIIYGNQIPLDEKTLNILKNNEGKYYSPELKSELQKIMADFYQGQGIYLYAQNYDFNNNILIINLAEARINDIEIVGNEFVPTGIIRKMIKLNVPSIYNQYKIEHIIKSLYATDLFYSVKPLIKKHESGKDLTLIFELKEKDKGLFFLSGQYFSAEKEPEIELGYHDYYTFGHIKPFFALRSGRQFGGSAGIEWYDIGETNLGVGLYYDKTNQNIDLFDWHRHNRENGFSFNEESTDLLLNYTTYDYINFSIGQRYKNYSLASDNDSPFYPRETKIYRPWVYQFQYDNTDQQLIPRSGLRAFGRWEEQGFIDNHFYPKRDIFFWYTLPLGKGSFWFKYKEASVKGDAPTYLWQALRRDLLPNGFRDTETFSEHYVYKKVSYVNNFIYGTSYEFSMDSIGFSSLNNSWAKTLGFGVAVYYPSFLGLFSAGVGANDFNTIFYLNLSKGL
jgi:predicted acylesterase/phospholipase RssA